MEEGMSYESDDINVSHPNHYQGADGMEVIDVIRNFTGPAYKGYLRGNIIKYILRYEKKNGVQDLEKAMWYLSELLDYTRKEQEINKIIVHGEEAQERMAEAMVNNLTDEEKQKIVKAGKDIADVVSNALKDAKEEMKMFASQVSYTKDGYLNKI